MYEACEIYDQSQRCVLCASQWCNQQISSWMSAGLLTLNSLKTEYLLIGLKKQLDKVHNSSLNTTHSARNLGFIFDEHLTFSDKFRPSLKLVTAVSNSFVVSVLTLIPPQLVALPPPSFTPNLTTVSLFTTIYLSLRLLASNRFRTLLPVQLLKLPNSVTSLLPYSLFTGSK